MSEEELELFYKNQYHKSKDKYKIYNNSKERKKWLSEYRKDKYKNDIKYKLSTIMRTSMNNTLKRKGKNKNHKSWKDIVGYSADDLKKHIEKQFLDGMTWENYCYDVWHIDHIIPISSFSFSSYEDEEFKKCWALENLRPLWKEENLSKGDKILPEYSGSIL